MYIGAESVTGLTLIRMSKVCESWSLEELREMDEEDMDRLLAFYKTGNVPDFETIRVGEELGENVFNGSFGWW